MLSTDIRLLPSIICVMSTIFLEYIVHGHHIMTEFQDVFYYLPIEEFQYSTVMLVWKYYSILKELKKPYP